MIEYMKLKDIFCQLRKFIVICKQKRQVKGELSTKLYNNPSFKKIRYNWFERTLIICSDHYIISNTILLAIVGLLCFITGYLYNELSHLSGGFMPIFQDVESMSFGVLDSQVTLLALIFPLVIAFIGVLIGKSSDNEQLWEVYKRSSGVMFVGFSSLFSSLFICITSLVDEWLPHPFTVVYDIYGTLWFIANLALSGWFFSKTMMFISAHSRMKTVLKDTISVPIERYIRGLIQINKDAKNTDSIFNRNFLSILFGQLEAALSNNNCRQYQNEIAELAERQARIELALTYEDEQEQEENKNWLLIKSGYTFHCLLDYFNEEVKRIAKITNQATSGDADYFKSLCYLYLFCFDNGNSENQYQVYEVTCKYIYGHYLLWVELLNWLYRESTTSSPNPFYEEVLKSFVSGWEDWQYRIGYKYKTDFKFDEGAGRPLLDHLEKTSLMLGSAIKYENMIASNWATDILVGWFNRFAKADEVSFSNSNFITLNTPYNNQLFQSRKVFNSPLPEEKALEESKENFNKIAVMNYWIDIRCITAAYLLFRLPENTAGDIQSGYKKNVNRLIESIAHKATDWFNHTGGSPIIDIRTLMDVYFRCFGSYEGQKTYHQQLNKHLRSLSSIAEPEWVTSRIYGSTGIKSEQYLTPFFKTFGIKLATKKFHLQDWEGFLYSEELLSHPHLSNNQYRLNTLKTISSEEEGNIKEFLGWDEEKFKEQKLLFEGVIDRIITSMTSANNQSYIDSGIDDKKLKALAKKTEGDTFSEKGPMPLPLFGKFEDADSIKKKETGVNINGFQLGEITNIEATEEAIDSSARYYISPIREKVSVEAFWQLLRFIEEKQEKSNLISMLEDIITQAEAIRNVQKNPILFVEWNIGGVFYQNAYPSMYPTEKKLPFSFSVETEQVRTYLCHVNGVEVHRIPLHSHDYTAVLLPKENFKTIKVKTFNHEGYNYVKAETDAKKKFAEGEVIGTLSLLFGIECVFDADHCFKYVLPKQGD